MRDLIDKILVKGLGQGTTSSDNNALFDLFQSDEDMDIDITHGELKAALYRPRIAIDHIHPDDKQVRKHFDQDRINDLAASIKANGVLQPVLVCDHPTLESDEAVQHYQIIAGERRWRASRIAELKTMPVMVLNISKERAYQLSLIENIQREQLNPIEEALAYKSMIEGQGQSLEEVAQSLGKSNGYISNTIRLLKLPETVQNQVVDRHISKGHARAIINADDPENLAKEIRAKGLNVRDTEARVQSERFAKGEIKNPDQLALQTLSARLSRIPIAKEQKLSLRRNAKNQFVFSATFDTVDSIEAFLAQYEQWKSNKA